MLNPISVIIITVILIFLYLWRITRNKKNLIQEIIICLVLCSVLMVGFYYKGITNMFQRGIITAQTPTTNTQQNELNYFEKASKKLIGTKPDSKVATKEAPSIKITYPQDGMIFPANTEEIIVKAEISDNTDPNPIVQGVGTRKLQPGFNPLTVVVMDKDGNTNSSFVIVQRLKQ